MQRILFFLTINVLVVATLSLLSNLLGFGMQVTSLLLFCFFWGMTGSLLSLMLSKVLAKWMLNIQLVSLMGPHKSLVETVHRLSRRAGLTEMPEVGIYQDIVLNAFATGPSRNNSLIALSSGLLANMSDEEIEGVLAHEIAHIANGDMVTMALVQGVVNAFVMFLSRITAFAIEELLKDKNSKDSRTNPFFQMAIVFILDILFGLLAKPVVAWFSRLREFKADRGAVDISGKDKILAALMALKNAYPEMKQNNKSDRPFRAMEISSTTLGGGILKYFSTHPPLDERIEALKDSH